MVGQILNLVLLLLSVSVSSSMGQTIPVTDAITISSANLITTGPLSAALNNNTSSDKDTNLISTVTKEPITSLTTTKESEVTPKQEASPTGATSQEETSTSTSDVTTIMSATTEDPSPALFTGRPVIDHFTADLPDTGHEDNRTNDYEMTSSSHPSGETIRTPKTMATKVPKSNPMTPKEPEKSPEKKKQKVILISIIMVVLILILVIILIAVVRCKRRRGSQSFQSQRSSKRQEVWAGQVPELGDGKMMQHPTGMENGTTGKKTEVGNEQEMVTFISGEKKGDSLVEVNELDKEDSEEEKKPLLEKNSQVNEEPEKLPVEEQMPAPTGEQELV